VDVRSYPAKLLLFGEHTVLVGSSSIAVPLEAYTMSWVPKSNEHPSWLTEYAVYLKEHCSSIINADKLDGLMNDQTIQGNIPIGYGLGSSGALSAAIYDICGSDKNHSDYGTHQQKMAIMESFFHGKSSGFDPLISYVRRPVYRDREGVIHIGDQELESTIHIGLIDSGIARKGREMIQSFLERYNKDKSAYFPLIELNTTVAHNLFSGQDDELLTDIKAISYIQLELMDYLITPQLRSIWRDGLDQGTYYMKLCGAGGGGFFLVFSEKKELVNLSSQVIWLDEL